MKYNYRKGNRLDGYFSYQSVFWPEANVEAWMELVVNGKKLKEAFRDIKATMITYNSEVDNTVGLVKFWRTIKDPKNMVSPSHKSAP